MRRSDKFDLSQDKPDWNMALFFLSRLDERLNDRDQAFNEGDLLKTYRVLRSVYANIHYFLVQEGHEEKEEELQKKFDQAKISFRNLRINDANIQDASLKNFELLLDDITILLYDLLFEYHLIFPKKHFKDPARALDSFM